MPSPYTLSAGLAVAVVYMMRDSRAICQTATPLPLLPEGGSPPQVLMDTGNVHAALRGSWSFFSLAFPSLPCTIFLYDYLVTRFTTGAVK
jgi:hypothetical protein